MLNTIDEGRRELIEKLAASASTLHERLSDNIYTACSTRNSSIAKKRLENWKKILRINDNLSFKKRLSWGNHPEEEELPLGEPLIKGKKLPSWTVSIEKLIGSSEQLKRTVPNAINNLLSIYNDNNIDLVDNRFIFLIGKRIHLQELIAPQIFTATEMLKSRLKNKQLDITLKALIGLQKSLLLRIQEISSKTLETKIALYKNIVFSSEENEEIIYTSFLQWFHEFNQIENIYFEYPVLARLVSTCVENWIADSINCLDRLANDKQSIEELFFSGQKLTSIEYIEDGLSDPHNGQQYVKRIIFSDNQSIIYKPRSISLLHQFNRAIEELNGQINDLTLATIKVISKESYGWVEVVNNNPCIDLLGGQYYYRRTGELLGLLYILRASDCHRENLIASGEKPYFIDCETLMHPRCFDLDCESIQEASSSSLLLSQEESVLSLGMLPQWDAWGDFGDVSALGSFNNLNSDHHVNKPTRGMGKEINADLQGYSYNNIPHYKKEIFYPNRYESDIRLGFRKVCEGISRLGDEFKQQWLDNFKGLETRLIYRPTRIYGELLRKTYTPKYLRDGVDWSLQFECLYTQMLEREYRPMQWVMVEAEIQQLTEGDIPRFSMAVEATSFSPKQQQVEIPLGSGHSISESRLYSLTPNFIKLQEEYIKASCYFYGHQAKAHRESLVESNEDNEQTLKQDEEILKSASNICSNIESRASGADSIGRSWIGIQPIAKSDKFQLCPLGLNLDSGNPGLGLLFAARACLSENDSKSNHHWKKLANSAFNPVINILESISISEELTDSLGLGGITGIGSIIYSLSTAGLISNQLYLQNAAMDIVNSISTDVIEKNESLDMISGIAGLLLSLLSLPETQQSQQIINLCNACGNKLIKKQIEVSPGMFAWPSIDGKPLTGMSHGAAGIALALLRLYKKTGEINYYNSAMAGIHYENSQYCIAINNWKDLRKKGSESNVSWCHGATGIGLSRMACSLISAESLLVNDSIRALEITMKNRSRLDQLCCGAMGQVELLLSGGLRFNDEKLIKKAKEVASGIIDSSGNDFRFQIYSNVPGEIKSVSFFQGNAGIGYQLLRLIAPEKIPCVLTLDAPINI